jgi:hypothetical protein
MTRWLNLKIILAACYAVPAIENPPGERFADQIELAGYAGAPAAVQPGNELRVEHWSDTPSDGSGGPG